MKRIGFKLLTENLGSSAPARLAVCGIALLLVLPAQAQVYRWVDENGVTQYSQTPPASAPAERMRGAPPPPAAPTAATPPAAPDTDLENTPAPAPPPANYREQLAANCAKARTNVEALERSPRIRLQKADGTVAVLTPAEHAAKLAETQKFLTQHCHAATQ